MREPIARHRTAISRTELSRPIKFALADGILSSDQSLFDYGCGLGDDLRLLGEMGFTGQGWDPVHCPAEPLKAAPVVNIGYVVNVIEDAAERQDALRAAWALTEEVLVVSARLAMEARALSASEDFADGYLTSRNTFQKFFDQLELRNWIDQTLAVSSVPAAPGVFYVFREEQARTTFLASRYRRRLSTPRLTKSAALFKEHEELLTPLLDFISERGRLPAQDELTNSAEIASVFGSIRRAVQVLRRVTDTSQWDEIAEERAKDLLIYLALSRFDGRPNYSRLPRALQSDVKSFFSNYKRACGEADDILFSLGQPGIVEAACQMSEIGKLTPTALYIHQNAVDHLSPLLRLFEGCARGYVGIVDGANLVKLYRTEPKISYLSYPDFEADPHPSLSFSLTVHLQTFDVKFRNFQNHRNRPVLHRKETFLAPDDPLYEKFARLTRIEESKGLYEDTSRIGMRDGWDEILEIKGYYFRGHRLLRRKSPKAIVDGVSDVAR